MPPGAQRGDLGVCHPRRGGHLSSSNGGAQASTINAGPRSGHLDDNWRRREQIELPTFAQRTKQTIHAIPGTA